MEMIPYFSWSHLWRCSREMILKFRDRFIPGDHAWINPDHKIIYPLVTQFLKCVIGFHGRFSVFGSLVFICGQRRRRYSSADFRPDFCLSVRSLLGMDKVRLSWWPQGQSQGHGGHCRFLPILYVFANSSYSFHWRVLKTHRYVLSDHTQKRNAAEFWIFALKVR